MKEHSRDLTYLDPKRTYLDCYWCSLVTQAILCIPTIEVEISNNLRLIIYSIAQLPDIDSYEFLFLKEVA